MPHDKQGITVTFAPPARGRYEADLVVEANGKLTTIHLIGDATGQGFDDTSFYACGCSGGFAPTGGAPILFALLFIVRRRRGSSSAR
jgi:MYXO-CTERM domain-containing protein